MSTSQAPSRDPLTQGIPSAAEHDPRLDIAKRLEWHEAVQHLLEQMAGGAELPIMLEALTIAMEEQIGGVRCAVLLVNDAGTHLNAVASPSMPADYQPMVQNLPIGPDIVSCGAAAYLNQAVISESVRTDARWQAFQGMVEHFNIGACWSYPIRSAAGTVLGTFAISSPTPRAPSEDDERVALAATHVASVIIEGWRRERALENSENLLSGIVGSAMDAIITIEESGAIVVFNAAAEQIFGISAAEVRGTTLDRFLPGHLQAKHRKDIEGFAAHGTTQRHMNRPARVRALRANGESFPLEATISRSVSRGRTLMTVILRDLTEQEALEQTMRQQQRMESLGRLASGVAHDFNNLMMVIRGNADALHQQLRDLLPANAALHEEAAAICAAVDHGSGLTRQLLAFSKGSAVQAQRLDVRTIVQGMERLLSRLLGDHITFRVDNTTDHAVTAVDPGQLEQVLLNLAVNARDAMPQGGSLLMRTTVHPVHALPAPVAAQWSGPTTGNVVVLQVTDTGSGMDEETRARAFEPFFSTKPGGQGSGLGLATAYGIIQQAGGSLVLQSAPGAGTTAWITLPHHDAPATAIEAAPAPSTAQATRTGASILLVEDNGGIQLLLTRLLTRAGYTVLSATNGHAACTVWDARRDAGEAVDLVITDVMMPEMGGHEMVQRFRAAEPTLPVLFISGYDESGGATEHYGSATAFLEKPFRNDALLEKVAQLLG